MHKEEDMANLRIVSSCDKVTMTDKWLHPDMTMDTVQHVYGSIQELK